MSEMKPMITADGMFVTAFGEKRPNTPDQLNEVLDDKQIDTTVQMAATIVETQPGEGHEHFEGFSAELLATNFDGEEVEIVTGGWVGGKEALLVALASFDCAVEDPT